MSKRGRPSAASLELQQVTGPIETIQRPDAPYDLTDEQAAEWWAVVNSMPADWFTRETHAMLADYCRHVVKSRRVAQLVADAEKEDEVDVGLLDKLYKMAERESRAIGALAVRMRISQQSTTNHRGNRSPKAVKKPWDG